MKVPFRSPMVATRMARRNRAPLAVGLLALAGAAAGWLVTGTPIPRIHDETSYLLAADTYARGRLANPPHPLSPHFEGAQILQHPTYASKYQPAQGLVMAFGQRVLGHPLAGVWLSAAALVAGVTWMLQALVPAPWALLGGVLTALEFGMAGGWVQTYWGGAVPATGAALLFGALAWMRREVSWTSGAALAAGSLILVFSRPFEGFVVFLFAVTPLLLLRGGPRRRRVRVTLASLAAAVALGAPLMGVYNQAVTGSPFTLPYQLHTEQYAAAPLFVFQAPPDPPEYDNERIARFHLEWERRQYDEQRSLAGWAVHALDRPVEAAGNLFFGPPRNPDQRPFGAWIPGVLVLPLLALPWLWGDPRARYGFAVVGGLFLCLTLVTYFEPHYVSVLAPVWMYLVVQSLRAVRARLPAGPLRRAVVPLALSLSVVLVAQSAIGQGIRFRDPTMWYVGRHQISEQLVDLGGRHLVLVRYAPEWNVHSELVYNSADIDGQAVVWAHSLGASADSALLAYYPGRTAWYLDVAPGASRLEPIARR